MKKRLDLAMMVTLPQYTGVVWLLEGDLRNDTITVCPVIDGVIKLTRHIPNDLSPYLAIIRERMCQRNKEARCSKVRNEQSSTSKKT